MKIRVFLVTLAFVSVVSYGYQAYSVSQNSNSNPDQVFAKLKAGDFSVIKTEVIPMAEAGSARAQFALGVAYSLGHGGLEKDLTKAFEWTQRAAQSGDRKAQVNLASMYYEGKGTEQDYAKAIKWYEQASEDGDANAKLALGKIYFSDSNYNDFAKAFHYFKEAANLGAVGANKFLAECYARGLGTERDEAKAKAVIETESVNQQG